MPSLENEKYERFCQEYLKHLNGPRAYREAGFTQNVGSSRVGAFQLLRNDRVRSRIEELMKDRAERTRLEQDMIVEELARIAFADLSDFVTWGPDGPKLVESDNLTSDQTAAVLEVSETETKDGGSRKIKLHDKLQALQLLGKHLNMFVDQVDHTSKGERIGGVIFEIVHRKKGENEAGERDSGGCDDADR